MQNTAARPTVVTVLAILALIGGLFGVLASFGYIALGGSLLIYGILWLVLSVVELAFAYGAWTMQPWAWSAGIGVEAGFILLSIIALFLGWNSIAGVLISIIIGALIIYWLFTPGVKAAFGKA